MNKMEQAQLAARPHTQIVQAPPKILVSSSVNFSRITDPSEVQYYHERPMMLNAWTQTTTEDFGYLFDDSLTRREQKSKNERDLLEKIHTLEENLRAHSEILAQMYGIKDGSTATAYGAFVKNVQQKQAHKLPVQQSTLMQQLQLQSAQMLQEQISHQHHQQQSQLQHQEYRTTIAHLTSVTSPLKQIPPPTESIKYTIIAEGDGGTNDEPIEIQISEDDGGLNLNSSADSGRLEICLADDTIVKEELTRETSKSTPVSMQPTSTTGSATPFFKRRKIESESQNSNYYLNDNGVLMPISTTTSPPTTSANAMITPVNGYAYKAPKSRNSGKSLLKPPRYKTPPQQSSSNNSSSDIGQKIDLDNVMVSIGPNNTRIPAKLYESMSWATASIATRKLLMCIFDRQTLATHSMTGKPSPAFKDHGKPLKQMLEPLVIQDIIFAVTRKCHVSEKEVRTAITTKCADENKMMKLQMNKTRSLRDFNKENVV